MMLSRVERRELRRLERRLRRKDRAFVMRFQRIITAAMSEPGAGSDRGARDGHSGAAIAGPDITEPPGRQDHQT